MFYTDLGEGNALVFIHGLGSKKESWQYQHELSSSYRLIMPDLRGHGESTVFENISIAVFAQDVIKLLESLDITTAHFCGLSMGGLVVQEIYRQKPEIVHTMILSNTMSYTPLTIRKILLRSQIFSIYNMSENAFLDFASQNFLFKKDPVALEEVKKLFLINKDAYIAASASAIESNYLFMLPQVTCPTLIIGASDDKIVPPPFVYQTNFFARNAELVFLDDCGHLANFEKKDEYNNILNNFLVKN